MGDNAVGTNQAVVILEPLAAESAGETAPGGAAPPAEGLFLAVVAAAVFVSVMAATMVNVVVPVIRAEFAVSEAQVGWVVAAHLLVFAIGVPLYGRISDLVSLRRLFCGGLLVFAAGSLICALAPNFLVLVCGRVVQAVGDAAIPALATVAVAKVLSPAGGAAPSASSSPASAPGRRSGRSWGGSSSSSSAGRSSSTGCSCWRCS